MPLPLPSHVSDFPLVYKITQPFLNNNSTVKKFCTPASPNTFSRNDPYLALSTVACSAVRCWPPLPHHRHRHHSPITTFSQSSPEFAFFHDPHQECAGWASMMQAGGAERDSHLAQVEESRRSFLRSSAPCRRPRCTDRTLLAGETVKSYNMEEGGAHALEQEVVVRPHYQQSHSGPD